MVSKMVNGLHLYSAFIDPMATKALYNLPHTHPFIHSFTHRQSKLYNSSNARTLRTVTKVLCF